MHALAQSNEMPKAQKTLAVVHGPAPVLIVGVPHPPLGPFWSQMVSSRQAPARPKAPGRLAKVARAALPWTDPGRDRPRARGCGSALGRAHLCVSRVLGSTRLPERRTQQRHDGRGGRLKVYTFGARPAALAFSNQCSALARPETRAAWGELRFQAKA